MSEDYTIYAVRAYLPGEERSTDVLHKLYRDLKKGKARFGWGLEDVKKLQEKWKRGESLCESESDRWSHAHFLLEVKPEDCFVYINMPKYGQCTIAKIEGEYTFGEKEQWDPYGDFRHYLPCEFLTTFDRNDNVVHPSLSSKLRTPRRAWYRIACKKEFEELLDDLKQGKRGKTPRARWREVLDDSLKAIAQDTQSHFPGKNLEPLVKELFENVPNVINVRQGPDKNGADLEVEFDSCPDIPGLERAELCAVQVKSYEGQMGYKRAIEDIRKAFASNSDYTCGLIVSTALELTEDFEKELHALREEAGKQVGILIGKDFARVLLKHDIFRKQGE